MGKIILVTSGKGGVGKTTTVAGLGAALSKKGKKVLLSDTDFGLRNLDLALGVESQVVYDVLDCLDKRCSFEDAVITFADNENLFFLPASQSRSGRHIDNEAFIEFFKAQSENFDYILLDSPAGLGPVFEMDAGLCDEAIIVVEPYISSVRDSDRCIDILMRNNVAEINLIINSFREELAEKGLFMKPEYIMDLLGIKLLGIVPYDESCYDCILKSDNSLAAGAYSNIAGRMLGGKIPVGGTKEIKISLAEKIKSLFKHKNKKEENGGV